MRSTGFSPPSSHDVTTSSGATNPVEPAAKSQRTDSSLDVSAVPAMPTLINLSPGGSESPIALVPALTPTHHSPLVEPASPMTTSAPVSVKSSPAAPLSIHSSPAEVVSIKSSVLSVHSSEKPAEVHSVHSSPSCFGGVAGEPELR